ncbi:unnamed protein product [Chondrus crispus]|uniref:DDE Tnp4 domain-containing protein n=1 Tax=Chondrus crispus TaxID=2769 RepID=R7Q932_CHOCR|nr:unnamed protein product [Chondrus crispus]CDF34559.1 unnamed protein product [Chondrus crispus]|eukprot:XP_005714378.1 unnamed protein product [Chondrus crispus]
MQDLDALGPLDQLAGSDPAHGNSMGEHLADRDDDELSFLILDEEMDKECGYGYDDMLHGGSTTGRSGNKARDFDAAVTRMRKLYFGYAGRPPVYNEIDFARRFGIPSVVFNRVYSELENRANFIRKVDALGRCGVHPLQRIIGALRILRYGIAYDAVDELVGVSESTMQKTVTDFCTAIVEVFGAEYLREPTEDDLKRILAVNESRGILSGEFPPRIPYTINGKVRDVPYYLADGIYPSWALFVKSSKSAADRQVTAFSRQQGAVRKDVERAFGVLMSNWHVLERPCRMWYKERAMIMLPACILLHNMNREARRDGYDVPLYERAVSGGDLHKAVQFAPNKQVYFQWETSSTAAPGTWAALASQRQMESEDGIKCDELRYDLIQHIWLWRKAKLAVKSLE